MALAFSGPLGAQRIEVRLYDAASRAGIAGTVVRLLKDSVAVGQSLTNGDGRATLRAPSAGTYRIRVNRIGFAAILTDTFSFESDQILIREIAMESAAIALPAVAVQSRSECGTPTGSNGALVSAIWEQVRTALTANDLTQRQWRIRLRVNSFQRDVSTSGDSLREVTTASYIVRGPPFAAPDPLSLQKNGFAILVGDEMTFGAPDAALLLTDDFAATHCFSAVPGRTDAVVGLAFQPVPRRRLPDIRGTLWVNRLTSELQYIEYGYTNLPPKLDGVGLGGRIDFRRLPNGAWIVSYWHIRMPRMDQQPEAYGRRAAFEPHLTGFVEEGARVTNADVIELSAASSAPTAVVSGRVVEGSVPLAGAVIHIEGDSDFVTTASDGRFSLRTTKGGGRTIMAVHPRLGLIDDDSRRSITLSVGDTTIADFEVPTPGRIAQDYCGVTTGRSGLVGIAWIADTATSGLQVHVSWEPTTQSSRDDRSDSGRRGAYVFCDLPARTSLSVRLQRGTAVLAAEKVKLEPGEFRWLELRAVKSRE